MLQTYSVSGRKINRKRYKWENESLSSLKPILKAPIFTSTCQSHPAEETRVFRLKFLGDLLRVRPL